jgi:hypothetical protein
MPNPIQPVSDFKAERERERERKEKRRLNIM